MSSKKVKFQGFVAVSFSKQEKKAIKERVITDGQCVEFFSHAAELGYKVSVSYAERAEFHTVTLYGNNVSNANAGYAMSIRHRDMMTCISAFYWLFEDTSMESSWEERFDTQGDNDW